jgi:hypothetical protein
MSNIQIKRACNIFLGVSYAGFALLCACLLHVALR